MDKVAKGSFTIDIKPLSPPPAEGISRRSINKRLSGDLEGVTKGEMYAAGDPKQGAAGYVAIEMFTGTLHGRRGGFALQHSATMDRNGQKMSVLVVPGSGTGALVGISGAFSIVIADGAHRYELTYQLPQT